MVLDGGLGNAQRQTSTTEAEAAAQCNARQGQIKPPTKANLAKWLLKHASDGCPEAEKFIGMTPDEAMAAATDKEKAWAMRHGWPWDTVSQNILRFLQDTIHELNSIRRESGNEPKEFKQIYSAICEYLSGNGYEIHVDHMATEKEGLVQVGLIRKNRILSA